ncbi:MAG: histidine--tRNA ligase [Firmicutes bacterium]|nr:histidine--tRNA ligase [Bacillota bacterium]
MRIAAPRGTNDILPGETELWQQVETLLHRTFKLYGYREIRTPVFEHTELFERGVGTTTDIVEKEMYTFQDRGGRSITLRPEGTAPVVRAFIEHRMGAAPQPTKVYYIGPMFRYERPQAGRYRQFHQFGVEILGASDPAADAEVIALPLDVYAALGISDVVVNLNSIGCPKCRPAYRDLLREVYAEVRDQLCGSCIGRFDRNPLRLLDCKSPECRAAMPEPPTIFGLLCPECSAHFDALRRHLDALGITCAINPRLVRGLDYYTRTTFEYTAGGLGSQDALGGGGRYDGLVEECGGDPTPGVGVACGLERCVLAMRAQQAGVSGEAGIDVFIVSLGDAARDRAFEVAFSLRKAGVSADFDMVGRGLRAQLRYADKLGARFVAIIGDEEIARGMVTMKNMATGEQAAITLAELAGYITRQG